MSDAGETLKEKIEDFLFLIILRVFPPFLRFPFAKQFVVEQQVQAVKMS